MVASLSGMFLGLVFGLIMAGPLGGVIGIVVGMSMGMLWSGARDAWVKVPEGTEVEHDEQSILCEPKGSVANVTFIRGAHDGRWLDVDRCSLCTPKTQVSCAKRCLLLIRDVAPGRTRAATG